MKILIIAQHILPMQTPRAHRATELAKELSRLGHDVTVYAVLGKHNYSDFEKDHRLRVKNIPIKFQLRPYSSDGFQKRNFIDKVSGRLFGKLFEFPNIEFMYTLPGLINREDQADLLISIADPHHIHWGCAKAKLKYPGTFPKKWIADCGDPFFLNTAGNEYHYGYYVKYEKLFCRLCNYITVPVKQAIEGYYPEFRNKIKVIPQGFSFNLPLKQEADPENAVPTFAYAGIFYKDIRNPSQFMDHLCSTNRDFRFVVFTKHRELLTPYKNILKDKLIFREPIDREQLITELKKMDFLLNIENINSPSQLPSKLIDYALTTRPILSINNVAFNTKLIDEFLSGNYQGRYILTDIEQYHISKVAKKFIELAMDAQ